ncbi:hypothetical protein ACFWXK_39255 [Streptomyces sp. NPDC059070]|uniref:hypothetical protein n=1 Tax=Streptomyces sp. NPDC059070 TaxID=3346713 RepID=UPI0036932B06
MAKPPFPVPTPGEGRRIGASTLKAIDSRLNALLGLDQALGSRRLRATAEDDFTLVTTLMATAVYDESTATGLHRLAARAAGTLGWLAYDDAHPAAQAFFETSIDLADAGGAGDIRAYFTALLAHQQCSVGEARTALALVESARPHAGRDAVSARTTAALLAASARAHAALGNATERARTAEAAQVALASDTAMQTDTLNSWVTIETLEANAGVDLLRLGRPRQALQHFEVLHTGAFPCEERPRDAALRLAEAGQAQLAVGEVEAAVSYAVRAQRYLSRVASARTAKRVAELRQRLSSYGAVAAVRQFLDHPVP